MKLLGASARSSKAPTAAKPSTPQEVASVENFQNAQFQVGLVHSMADHPIWVVHFAASRYMDVFPGSLLDMPIMLMPIFFILSVWRGLQLIVIDFNLDEAADLGSC
ncbi:unnamed protein product [Calypogeia fissa]